MKSQSQTVRQNTPHPLPVTFKANVLKIYNTSKDRHGGQSFPMEASSRKRSTKLVKSSHHKKLKIMKRAARLWWDTEADPTGSQQGIFCRLFQVYLPSTNKGSTQKLLFLFWHLKLLWWPDDGKLLCKRIDLTFSPPQRIIIPREDDYTRGTIKAPSERNPISLSGFSPLSKLNKILFVAFLPMEPRCRACLCGEGGFTTSLQQLPLRIN